MKISFTKLMLAIMAVIAINIQVNAQNVIWTEDFGGGQIPATWTNVDASGQVTTVWEYTTTGTSFGLTQPAFAAPTAANGFVEFNSDGAGALTSNHDLQLTTDAIDCSSLTTVVAKFSNQYAYYSTGGVSVAEIGSKFLEDSSAGSKLRSG